MDRETAEKLMLIYSRVDALLDEATKDLSAIEDKEERKQVLRSISRVIASIQVDLTMPILRDYPQLESNDEIPVPDPPLSLEQQELVDHLSITEVAAIDNALLRDASDQWRKVARIVASALAALQAQIPGVPDLFYEQRVRHLVATGHLESQGNLAFMRFSEVRLLRYKA